MLQNTVRALTPDAANELLTEVITARAALATARHARSPRPTELDLARHRLVKALRAYNDGLAATGRPTPTRLLHELRLHQGLDRLQG